MRRKLWLVMGVVALAALSVSCVSNASQDALKPQGPYAQEINNLFTSVFWIAAAIFFLVEGVLVLFVVKYRHRMGRTEIPPQIHGNTRLEIAWTILPALILVGVAVPTVATIWDLAGKPTGDVMHVTVIGHQFWWEYRYTDPDMKTASGNPITTANVMVIPENKTVYLSIEAEPKDIPVGETVIHSFWIPELAGTQDAVPGRTNHIYMQADHPGTYWGQCKELCGLSHANMRTKVVAETATDFATWVAAQQAPAARSGDLLAQRGAEVFAGGQCILCHTIDGLQTAAGNPVAGIGGPNLTHFASRDCFAGCTFRTNPDELRKWLADPPARKPGAAMPNYHLSEDQINALVAYLLSLN